MEKTAIIGVGQTKQVRNNLKQNFAEMVYEATTAALNDAGLEIKDIDNVITVSNDFWDGRTISSMAVQDACGAYEKNVSTVEGDGTFGAYYALTRILSGSYKNTLVVAHSKGSESDTNLITNGSFENGNYNANPNFMTLGAGATNIDGWTVGSGSIDWILTYWQASNGRFSLDLSGTPVPGSAPSAVLIPVPTAAVPATSSAPLSWQSSARLMASISMWPMRPLAPATQMR